MENPILCNDLSSFLNDSSILSPYFISMSRGTYSILFRSLSLCLRQLSILFGLLRVSLSFNSSVSSLLGLNTRLISTLSVFFVELKIDSITITYCSAHIDDTFTLSVPVSLSVDTKGILKDISAFFSDMKCLHLRRIQVSSLKNGGILKGDYSFSS